MRTGLKEDEAEPSSADRARQQSAAQNGSAAEAAPAEASKQSKAQADWEAARAARERSALPAECCLSVQHACAWRSVGQQPMLLG